jgi:misacylated tRNA(Ala) deacylase
MAAGGKGSSLENGSLMSKDYDPRMHSAEHILNQTMVRLFNRGRSFTTHLEAKKSRIYYHFDRDLTPEETKEIEAKVNQIIQTDAVVREEFLSREEAGKQFNLSRLPDQVGDTVRIIRIGDYDACPCIGAHVDRTKQIGTFHIYSTSYEDGVLKIRFKLTEEAGPGT